jgi:hypothetical protein
MDPERPPEIDADYRLVHGPWPRWVMQLGLLRLAVWTVGVVLGLMFGGLAVLWAVFWR